MSAVDVLAARVKVARKKADHYAQQANDLLVHVRKYKDWQTALLLEADELDAEIARRTGPGTFTPYRLDA